DVPPGHNIIGSRWVFKVKEDGRFKGRVVATGWSQRHGIDCGSTFAPVCRIESQRLLLAIAAAHGWSVAAMDISTAFLIGKLSKKVYMRQAPGFETKDSQGRSLIMKLSRSIYGLRQSPKAWNVTIDKDLRTIGFLPTASDACVYVKGSGDSYVMLTLYVDDLLNTGPNHNTVAKVRNILMEKSTMTDFGDATRILRIEIFQDKKRSTISITQAPYVLSLLDKYGMADCNLVHIPVIGNELTAEPEGSVPLSKEDTIEYQRIVGSLISLCQCTRFDICFAVSQAAGFMSKPTPVQMGADKRILRYLRGKPNLHIIYICNSNFEFIGFWDASYGTGNPKKARSTSGSMYFLSGGIVHFSTNIQKIAAQSTTEAELIAMSSCAKQGIYLCGILGELGWRTLRSARIFCDNKGALFLAGQGSNSSRSKHLAIGFMGLRKWIIDKKLVIGHVSTKGQLSDILTKFLARLIFTELLNAIINRA
ncbi:unnamed protein product, partial [Ascophyllum nodosum]